jgi:hypothetical protein
LDSLPVIGTVPPLVGIRYSFPCEWLSICCHVSLGTLLRIALDSLSRHTLRTALTTLGIAVGVAATLCTIALGDGSAAQIHNDLLTLGDNLLWIQASVRGAGGVRDRVGGVAATLTVEDSIAIPLEIPEIPRCTPQVDSRWSAC